MTGKLLRIDEVLTRCNFSRSALYRAINERGFPAPRRFSSRCLRWEADKIEQWIESRPFAIPGA